MSLKPRMDLDNDNDGNRPGLPQEASFSNPHLYIIAVVFVALFFIIIIGGFFYACYAHWQTKKQEAKAQQEATQAWELGQASATNSAIELRRITTPAPVYQKEQQVQDPELPPYHV